MVLLAMGALLGAILFKGFFAPLRERLRRSERILERQEKLSSLGVLAAGIAHEIRNPLTSIRVRLFTQQALLEKGTEVYEDNVFLAGEITRLEKIVREFLEFARPSEPCLTSFKVTEVIRETRSLMSPELEKSGLRIKEE